jgi:hypothetical protein
VRANFWSNPNITVTGLAIGIPEGQANAAENWKTLNQTASTVANFRTCVVTPCDVPPTVVPAPTPPPNDNFAAATAVTTLPTNFNLDSTAATSETGEPSPSCATISHTVWYNLTLGATTQVTISTKGSRVDTVLGVYTGNALNGLTQVTCNDDINGAANRQSQVTFTATGGTTYRVQVGSFSTGNGGPLTISFTGNTPTNTPTATVTATRTITPTATATRTATAIPTPVVNCNPRPKVTVNVTPAGNNTLNVSIAPGANGWINQVQIGAATNARVDIAGQTGLTGGQNVVLPPATTSLTFQVHHATPGQSTTVPLTIFDTCGSWPTFVGGGANAF